MSATTDIRRIAGGGDVRSLPEHVAAESQYRTWEVQLLLAQAPDEVWAQLWQSRQEWPPPLSAPVVLHNGNVLTARLASPESLESAVKAVDAVIAATNDKRKQEAEREAARLEEERRRRAAHEEVAEMMREQLGRL